MLNLNFKIKSNHYQERSGSFAKGGFFKPTNKNTPIVDTPNIATHLLLNWVCGNYFS